MYFKIMKNVFFVMQRILALKKAMIISGIVCAIPFVFENLYLVSWFMYIPCALCFFDESMSNKKATIRAFLFGFGYYFLGYSWLFELYPLDFAGFTNAQSIMIIIIALTLVPAIHSAIFAICFGVLRAVFKKRNAVLKIIAFPCAIVFTEFLQSVGPLAFPWCKVSVAQGANLAILQSTSLFGSYFIAYIVLFVNTLLAFAIKNEKSRKKLVILAVCVFSVNYIFGSVRFSLLSYKLETTEKITAVALQGNISSKEKWGKSATETVELYMGLAEKGMKEIEDKQYKGEAIFVIPETAFPFTLKENSKTAQKVKSFCQENDVTFAVGAFSKGEQGSANSVFVFTPDGEISEPYKKQILVPFGEYLPYRSIFEIFLPILTEINMLSEDVVAGKESIVTATPAGRVGMLICYESIFPPLCRQSVINGAEVILISTNDSWFGNSSALRHHEINAVIRAIENNVPVIRAANTGISAIIRPDGKIVTEVGADECGYALSEVPKGMGATLYTKTGDIILYLCLVYFVFSLIFSVFSLKKT